VITGVLALLDGLLLLLNVSIDGLREIWAGHALVNAWPVGLQVNQDLLSSPTGSLVRCSEAALCLIRQPLLTGRLTVPLDEDAPQVGVSLMRSFSSQAVASPPSTAKRFRSIGHYRTLEP
jgi:hypothetical protein